MLKISDNEDIDKTFNLSIEKMVETAKTKNDWILFLLLSEEGSKEEAIAEDKLRETGAMDGWYELYKIEQRSFAIQLRMMRLIAEEIRSLSK